MTKNIYFKPETWELFEHLCQRANMSRGDFIHELLLAYIRAEGGHSYATH